MTKEKFFRGLPLGKMNWQYECNKIILPQQTSAFYWLDGLIISHKKKATKGISNNEPMQRVKRTISLIQGKAVLKSSCCKTCCLNAKNMAKSEKTGFVKTCPSMVLETMKEKFASAAETEIF